MKLIIFVLILILNCLPFFVSSNSFEKNVQVSPNKTQTFVPKSRQFTNSVNKIANGKPANQGEFPYIVIFKPPICSGVLIHPRWVLTLRTCFGPYPGKLEVAINTDNGLFSGPKVAIERIINTNPKDSHVLNENIALVRLKKPINTPGIHPAKLVKSDTKLIEKMPLVMAGWGRVEGASNELSKKLLKADTILQPSAMCKKEAPGFDNNLLCSGGPDTNICPGDWGGPLLIKGKNSKEDIVIGLASLIQFRKCDRKLIPSIWVNIQVHLNWIKKVLKQYRDSID